MNNEFENALNKAALILDMSPKQALDGAIKIAIFNVIEHLVSDQNTQYHATGIIKRFCEQDMDNDRYHILNVINRHLQRAMNASAPFEDVIGGFYESLFLKETQSDQISDYISLIMTDDNCRSDDGNFKPYGCKTIVETMAYLQQIFGKNGKDKFLELDVSITDPDENVLRVAVYQVMANCFRHDVRFSSFQAFCFDTNNGFQDLENHEVWGVAAKTGHDRQNALMKAKSAGRGQQIFRAA